MTISHKWSIPLYFSERYFLFKSNAHKSLSVIYKHRGRFIHEVENNLPIENPISFTHKIPIEEIAASDKITGKLLYRINLGPLITIRLFQPNRNERKIMIDGDRIIMWDRIVQNHSNGRAINIAINSDDSVKEGLPIPDELIEFLGQY